MADEGLKIIASRITEARKALNMTQKQFAEKMEISRSALCMYEAGTSKPDVLFMNRLAQIAPFSAEYLLGLSDVKEKEKADMRLICRETGLSERSVEQLHRYGKACQPRLNQLLEDEKFYFTWALLMRIWK